ncbi:hypothetical protein QTP86_002213 [Hemibagrus guttatus]|nr:hypothetical protein QTP86_002213 [Hemibagrus guttatus]
MLNLLFADFLLTLFLTFRMIETFRPMNLDGFLVTITTCSTQTIMTLLKSLKNIRQHREEDIIDKRKNVIAIITANMIVFIVCFTPIHAAYLINEAMRPGNSSESQVCSVELRTFSYEAEWRPFPFPVIDHSMTEESRQYRKGARKQRGERDSKRNGEKQNDVGQILLALQ